MPFSNPIIGGEEILIREAMKSDNFVTDVSGWIIRRDGTAEFQDVKVRGDISGSTLTIPDGAGPGTPRIVIDNTGLHVFDAFSEIATINPGAPEIEATTIAAIADNLNALALGANAIALLVSSGSQTLMSMSNGIVGLSDLGVPVTPATPGLMRFGAGVGGGYCDEEWALAAQVIPNAALTPLTGMVLAQSHSDYATALNTGTGTWTCPEDGRYDMTLSVGFTASVAAARMILRINSVVGAAIYGNLDENPGTLVTPQPLLVCLSKWFAAGNQVQFQVRQDSGAAKTVSTAVGSYLSICRHL